MEPIIVHPCVYVLKLEDDCWYVGITYNLNIRMAQHWGGSGAKWTRLHKPLSIVEVVYPAVKATENEVTKQYFERYGKERVRGGSWCRIGQDTSESEKST